MRNSRDYIEHLINTTYTLIVWPDVQILMEESWFEEEAVLETEGRFGSSAYFIPTSRLEPKIK